MTSSFCRILKLTALILSVTSDSLAVLTLSTLWLNVPTKELSCANFSSRTATCVANVALSLSSF